MTVVHIYSKRHIKNQVHNVKQGDWIWLDDFRYQKRWSLFFKINDINEKKLKINYFTDFMELNKIMNDIKIVGNPPYNDGSKGRTPIYDKFLEKLSKIKPDSMTFIIPTNWFSQPESKLGKDVRTYLKDMGLYKIQLNPVDLFENATVSTCTVFCKKDNNNKIELLNVDSSKKYIIDDLSNHILPEFDTVSRKLIEKLKPLVPYITYPGDKGNTNRYRIVTSYMCYNIISENPLNEIKVIPPEYEKQSGYRVFAEFNTEQEASTAVNYYSSFWHSKLVQFILRRTRTSTTLDNPQIKFVPKVDNFNKIFTDQELYKLFSLTEIEINKIENDSRKYN